MPRINLTKEALALGVGALDTVLETYDRNNGGSAKPFQNLTDWGRTVVAVGSALAYMSNMLPDIAEPVLYASSALAAKSVTRLVTEGLSAGTAATAMRPGGHSQLALRSVAARTALTGGLSPAGTREPEFAGVHMN